MIAGGLLTLAVFVFVTALINREWTYVIFAVWLVGNLRLCANAMGWDMQWVGRVIPPEYLQIMRQLTFAAYYLLTAALFSSLFRRELKVIGYKWLLRIVQYVGLVLLGAAIVLPYARFIPALWVIAGFGIFVLIFLLARLVWMTRSRTVLWYVGSLAIVLFATFSEVMGAAFGIKLLVGGVNTVMAALSSSMMAAFAIAEQMRAEREHRRQAQTELRNTYDVTPIGLFTLDSAGHFVRANPALRSMLSLQKAEYKVRHWNDYFESGAWGALQALASKGSEGELEMGGAASRGNGERRFLLKATRSNGWIEGSLQDVTERSKAIERLRFLAEHDPLTGSLNRRGVEKAIAAQSEDADVVGARVRRSGPLQARQRSVRPSRRRRSAEAGRHPHAGAVCGRLSVRADWRRRVRLRDGWHVDRRSYRLLSAPDQRVERRAVSGRQPRVPGEGIGWTGGVFARRACAGRALACRSRVPRGEEEFERANGDVSEGGGGVRRACRGIEAG